MVRIHILVNDILNKGMIICKRIHNHATENIIWASPATSTPVELMEYEKSANMLPVVSQICRFAPQLHESAGGLPKMKIVSHSCSLAGSTSAMEVSIPIAFVLLGREHECNESFKLGRPPALSLTPQLHESAGGLPSLKLSLHSCSLPGSTNAMGIETSIALVLPAREHECNTSFGKVYWVRTSEVLGWTFEFSEDKEEDELSVEDNNDGRINDLEANNGIDESDMEEVLETLFDQPDEQKDKHSEDPFGLYPLLNKENIELARKVTEKDHSLSHPSGFTLKEGLNEGNTVNLDMKDYGENERDGNSFVNLEDGKDNSESVNKNSESKRSGHSKYSVLPRTGGSILNLMEEVVKVGQTMGYNMDGCIKDITEIIESQGEFGVNR
ncbi:hypothetical protein Tco_0978443 [Tanacetum coccineum]|uniref:RNA-directed DNA polymerase, eukaryota n=1 Tax=Tanacetum coccineum TaxID=301880 RepID=A0ABQ5EMZ5_9ASTR